MNNIKQDHFSNLLPEIQRILYSSDSERIASLNEDRWINYPVAKNIIDILTDLLHNPRKIRMPNMLLVGGTNNGKSFILDRFLHKNLPYDLDGQTYIPVISVLAPAGPDLSSLYNNILQIMSAPYRRTDKASSKEDLIRYYFSICDVKMLLIDEIHNILSGPVSKQKNFMNALKNMSNGMRIVIVLSGIADALHATNTDAQINNRFRPVFLPKWKIDRDFLSLLSSIEKTLPLRKQSNLGQVKEIVYAIADKSEGYIGEVMGLITAAARYAIKSGSEIITIQEIDNCGFVKPSERKNYSQVIDL